MLRTFLLLAVASALLGGCGGRAARPIPTQQSFDADMSCPQLAAELASNKTSINRLNGELGDLDGQNAAVMVGVILAGPGMLFALDNGDAQQKEIAAFQTRNARLTELGAARDCGDLASLAPDGGASAPAGAPAKIPQGTGALAAQPSTTASAGTTTSTATAEQAAAEQAAAEQAAAAQAAAEQAAAQAEFDAWLAANHEPFKAALTDLGRRKFLPGFESGFRTVETVANARVLARDAAGWTVEMDYRAGPDRGATTALGARIRLRVPGPGGDLEQLALAS